MKILRELNEAKYVGKERQFFVDKFVEFALELSYGLPYSLDKNHNLHTERWMYGQLAEVGSKLLRFYNWEWGTDNYQDGIEEASRYLDVKKIRLQINRKIKEHLRKQL